MTDRDEPTVRKLTKIHDFCRQLDTDPTKVMPIIEPMIHQTEAIRSAADVAGLNQRQRRVLADALGKSIREGME